MDQQRRQRLKADDYSPTPTEIIRRFVVFLRGFHWHRERPKVTDLVMVILTVLVAGAAIVSGLIFQEQLTEVRKQTRLSVRPWIGLDEGAAIETTPLTIDASGNASLMYQIKTKNYGTTPATNVWAFASLVVADDLNTVYEEQKIACGDAVIGKPDIGLILFPGKDRTFNRMPSITQVSRKHDGGLVSAWLAGCIGYRDQFNYLCRTRFIWNFRSDNGGEVVPSFPTPIKATVANGHFVASVSGEGVDSCQIPKYE